MGQLVPPLRRGKILKELAVMGGPGGASTAGAYHLLTIVHICKPHISYFYNLFTTTNESKYM
jgi:hypothetical protein